MSYYIINIESLTEKTLKGVILMIGIIVGTHGDLSKELVKSAEMIYGEQKNIGCVTFKPGEGIENLLDKYNKLIQELNCTEGILVMVDLFGGSPFNAASMIALEKEDMEVITGVNMPMLLEVFASRDISSSLSELLEIAKNGGKNAIKQLEKQAGRNLDDDDIL
ncbi:PTS system mannose-specific EIIAB component [Clostridium beijerinckii]|nr:PTS system mannose-specific EIIAB component [Clostridium beijerinckii]OOM70228.1 PTS system mannose-specific EIIAB component [Clostridium beijerinckii]CUU49147.1 PTS system, mannose/fructose/sorbose family, IIA subunit [Clostridium beijerinckii]